MELVSPPQSDFLQLPFSNFIVVSMQILSNFRSNWTIVDRPKQCNYIHMYMWTVIKLKILLQFMKCIYHFKVYDGPRTTSPSQVYTRHERPVLVSKSSTIILVFNTGSSNHRCCHPVGWKASYQLVSSSQWNTMPSTSKSQEMYCILELYRVSTNENRRNRKFC